ncbi:MAG: hypothetical protein CMF23_11320 [Ignavibacteriae bacterium]|nr:hypothetical protein [Ignavibacteriota bacterium]
MKTFPPFSGFPKDIFNFLNDLEKNNNVEWFNLNKDRYQNNFVIPAKSFITEIAPFFQRLNPAIRHEPKFNETIMRINKDMRFAKGAPYKNYFLIHFGRFKLDSEFFIYFDKNEVQTGIFLNKTEGENLYFKENLIKYKKELTEVFEKYNLNKNFALYNLNKEPEIVKKSFDVKKDFELLEKMKFILFQKIDKKISRRVSKPEFLIDSIKLFSLLYPLYIFAISPNPIKLLEEFEENFGIPESSL